MRPQNIAPHDIKVIPLERLDVAYVPQRWHFADQRRREIDAHFAELQRENPALWNGRVLLLRDFTIVDRAFRGDCFDADYASFISWQDWGFPDTNVRDCFAMAAIQSADGAFLLGVMGAHTFNAGQIYFPCGTPDPSDIVADRLDFEGSARRELAEETGLDIAEFAVEPGWYAVFSGNLIAQMKLLRARQAATELRARILDYLASERKPELADIRIVRSPADFDPMMPSFTTAFLHHMWSCGS